jgi:hypothetical protein
MWSIAKMGLDEQTILNYRIPARMRELQIFVRLGEDLMTHESEKCLISLADKNVTVDARVLLHALADSSVVISRSLLHFLGVRYNQSKDRLEPATFQTTDLSMAHINLPSADISVLLSGWDMPEAECERLLALCIKTGNKVSAHFTSKSAYEMNAGIEDLVMAQKLILNILNREIYQTKGRTLPILS